MRRLVEGLLFWVLAAHVYHFAVSALRYVDAARRWGRLEFTVDPSFIGRVCREIVS